MSLTFDATYYLNQNPDVLQAAIGAGVDASAFAQTHYSTIGFRELRDPNANFDTSYYLTNNTDVAGAGIDPFQHFLSFGAAENRAPTAALATAATSFDETTYLNANADVQAAVTAGAFTDGYQHWVLFGQFENRAAQTTDGTNLGSTSGTSGETLAFTTGIDDLTGTSSNDTITALQTGGNDETFSAFDALNGGNGTDTINITNTEAAALNVATVSNVENIVYRSVGGGGDIDLANFTGESSLVLDRFIGTGDVANLDLATALTVRDSSATANTTVTYTAAGVTGASDAASVTVDGVTDGAELDFAGAIETFTVTASGSDSRFDNFVLPGTVTALTVNASAGFRVDDVFTAAALTSLTVSGAGAVNITPALANTVTTIDASGSTGGVTLTSGGGNQTITGGTGDDTVDVEGTLTNADTINLGDGNDTLRIDIDGLAASASDLNVTNVETLRFDNTAANNGAINLDNVAFTGLRIDAAAGAAQAATAGVLTLTDIATTITSIDLIGAGSLNDNVAFNGVDVDYDVAGTTNVSAATVNINNGGTTGDDFFVQKVTLNNTETINVVAADIGSDAADELTITEIEGNDVTALNITSNGEVIINDVDGANLETVSLTGVAAGGASVTITNHSAAATITGSAGNDIITNNDDNNAATATVDLGAGNDTYVSTDVTDTITTGAGSDTIRFGGDVTDNENIITDFTAGAGGDIIDFATNDATATNAASSGTEDTGATAGDDITEGLIFFTGDDLTEISDAQLVAALAGHVEGDTTDNNEVAYIVAGTGTNVGIWRYEESDALAAVSAGDVELIATLNGAGAVSGFDVSNFADFV